ncbi:MAG: type II toxin-antitoxin system RelE/ParE family toxin [Rhabdochlamydiaceae bacterium]|jgi:proteic killer suppression protein
MIQSFADKTAEAIFNGIHTHGIRKDFSSDLVKAAERRLDLLNGADSLEFLHQIPSMKGEGGVRDAHGKYSIPIDTQWRLAFGWNDGPENVEIKCW